MAIGMCDVSAPDTYKSISKPSSGVYRDSGSKFISLAFPVSSEEEIKNLISDIKKKYYDARHHCYAYRLGQKGEIWRANDDGEPSSSAGRPILGQLLSNELTDILVVVVRYFGGTKLGIPGLIKAYKSTTIDALSKAEIIEKVAEKEVEIFFGYNDTDSVMKIIKHFGATIKESNFNVSCRILAVIRESLHENFVENLNKTISAGL